MKILSIDIGIKNLAYAILEVANANANLDKNSIVSGSQDFKIIKWDVINLCNKFIPCSHSACSKQANFHKNASFYCKNHTKKTDYSLPICNIKTLHKQSVANLSTLVEKYDLKLEKPINKSSLIKTIEEYLNSTCFEAIETINANNVNLIDLGISLKNELNELFNNYDLNSIDQIIIENQISPIANRMKSLQGMISQYFIDCNNHNIVFISATNKLKAFLNKDKDKEKSLDKDKEKSLDKDKKISYSERKKLSIVYTKQLLENKNMLNDLTYFAKHSKKDDLADCLLQGIYYLDNKQDNI
jgi:hypothetical protein